MKHSERGITLIEVLASIVILSIIGTVIWNVFFQGSKYSKAAVSKNFMVQQANIIMASLNRIHQTSSSYSITNTPNCQITITYIKDNSSISQTQVLNNNQMCFSFTSNVSGTVNTNITNPQITIIVNDARNQNNSVSVSTTLYRLKGISN